MHYDSSNSISEDDVATVDIFSSFLTELVFVTNSSLSDKELNKVCEKVCSVQKRENIGFDFGAWRDILLQYGQEGLGSFDELVLLNNSCFPPVFDIREMFAEMEDRALDFWGNTIFPYSSDGEYIHRDCIPEHLQSYFLVFGKKVLESNVFWDFWRHIPNYTNLIDVIANCESQLTKILSDAGFVYQPYIMETYYMSQFLNNYAVPYEKPISLLLLKNSFIKKKCYQYLSLEERFKLEWILNAFKK